MTVDFHSLSEHFERVHSRRLALRQVALADSWPLFQATRNPLFNRNLLWEQPGDETLVIDRVDSIVEAARRGRLTALSAVIKESGEWVSLYRFQPYAANPEYLEMGIWTSPNYWHGRYSLELVRACIDAAFQLFDVPVLVGAAALENRSSCKLMELSGMTPTKLVYRLNEAKTEVELQEFEITREAWAEARKRAMFEQIPVRAGQAPSLAPLPTGQLEKPNPERRRVPAVASEAAAERGRRGPSIASRPPARRSPASSRAKETTKPRRVTPPNPDQYVLELVVN